MSVVNASPWYTGAMPAVPHSQPPAFGVPAVVGRQPGLPEGVYSVGGRGDALGTVSSSGAAARGFKYSDILVTHSKKTKIWNVRGFERDQLDGQLLFGCRASGEHPDEAAMATLAQINSLMREVHEKTRSIDRMSRFETLDDRQQIDEFIYRMSEGFNALFLLGLKTGRITNETRRRALDYLTVGGIAGLWNPLGVLSNSGAREPEQNAFVLNIGVQGPQLVANVFQSVDVSPTLGEPLLGAGLRKGDSCSVVLRRRYSPATQQFEEFCYEPVASANRFLDSEQLEYVDEDGYAECGVQTYVGHVIDVVGGRPDPLNIVRMRGIGTTWQDAHAAHRDNRSRVKLALGFECGRAADA